VLLASWAVVLALSPAVAEAQGIAQTNDPQQIGTERIVVSPGDSLWSISEERLGPNATPQQIASQTERIYALNQNQIGADPNLIFPGQKLSAPPAVAGGEPSTTEPSTGATSARGTTKPAEAGPTDRAAAKSSGTADQASRTPIGATEGEDEKASDPVAAAAVNLPEVVAAAPVPAVRSLAAKASPRSPIESLAITVRSAVSAAESAVVGAFPPEDYLGRKQLGLGIVVLTLIVCGLMAWKLPLRRGVGDSAAWGIPRGYPNHHADSEALDRYADTSAEVSPTDFGPGRSLGGSEDELSVAEKNDLGRVGIVGAVRGRRERIGRKRAREVRENYATLDPLLRDKEEKGKVGNGIPTAHVGNGTYPPGSFAPVRRRQRLRRGRLQSSARQVRRGLSHGAHSPDVRRMLRRRRGRGRR
jgi:LysM repeat protein